MTRLSPLDACQQALDLLAWSRAAFVPSDLARLIKAAGHPEVAACIPAAANTICADLKDGTGRFVYVPHPHEVPA